MVIRMHELGVTDEEIEHIPHLMIDLHTALIPRRVAVCAGLVRLLPRGQEVCRRWIAETLRHARGMMREPTSEAKLRAAQYCAASLANLEDVVWKLITDTIIKREAA